MSIDTSSAGRRQFSELKANRVRYSMPCVMLASITARTASTPREWPATRGRCRAVAQRPLPSMMIATCRGLPVVGNVVLDCSGAPGVMGGDRYLDGDGDRDGESGAGGGIGRQGGRASDRHDFLFLLDDQPVDLGNITVG